MTSSGLPVRFGRNVLANYGLSIVSVLVALLTTPLLTHGLGAERFGVWVLAGAIIPYLELLELGLASATVAAVARHRAAGEDDQVECILSTSFFVLMIPGALALVLIVGSAAVLPVLLHVPAGLVPQARLLLILLGADLAVSIPGDTFGGMLIAEQRYDLLNLTLAAVMVGQALTWLIVLKTGGGLVALGVGTVAISLAGQVWRYRLAKRLLPRLRIRPSSVDGRMARALAGPSGWFSLQQLNGLASATCDIVVVGAVVGVRGAGVYAVGQRLSNLASNLLTPATDVLFPHAADSVGRGETADLGGSVWTATRLAVGLAVPTCTILVVLASPALLAWVGPRYTSAATVTALLAGAIVVQGLTQPGVSVLSGMGVLRTPTLVGAGGVVFRVLLAVALGYRFGIVGVAAAALVASVITRSALFGIICRRFRFRPGVMLGRLLAAHGVPIAVACGAAWLLWGVLVSHGVGGRASVGAIADVAATGLAMLVAYGAVLSRTGLDPLERRHLVARLHSAVSLGRR